VLEQIRKSYLFQTGSIETIEKLNYINYHAITLKSTIVKISYTNKNGEHMKFVIIGSDAAGMSATSRDKRKDPNFDVLEGVQTMCQMFWGPDSESCRQMMEGNYFHPFEVIFTGSEAKSSVLLDNINSIIKKFDTHQSFFDHLNECYVRLFVNCKEGIVAPLYESCYEFENAPMMGRSAVEMTQRFKSKGLSMENIVHEPPDHLAVELEYLFFLLQQEDELILDEAASFAGETMLPWVKDFNQRLKSGGEDCRFYSLVTGILVLLLELIPTKQNGSGQSHL